MVILDFGGIFGNFKVSKVFRSFLRFRGYFGNFFRFLGYFGNFGNILDILEVWGRGVFSHFRGFGGIFLIL